MRPRPILRDMPHHIKQRIVNLMDPVTKLTSLKRCSKEYKTLVNQSSTQFHNLCITFFDTLINLEFFPIPRRSITTSFVPVENGIPMEWGYNVNGHFVRGSNYVSAAIEHFLKITSNPKMSFEELGFMPVANRTGESINRFMTLLRESLSSLDHLLSVKKVSFWYNRNQEHFLSVLPFLEPGRVKELHFETGIPIELELDRIVDLEQWRSAKTLEVLEFNLNLPYLDWQHFERVVVNLEHLKLELVTSVIENFHQNPSVQSTELRSLQVDSEDIQGYLNLFEIAGSKWKIGIPERNQFLEVDLDEESIKIVRCSRE